MEQSFINPSTYGEIKFIDNKNASLISHPNSKLSSPYAGVVVYDMTPDCENSIKIKHSFNNEIVYSVFCGIGQQIVANGDKIKQGEMIGKFGDNKIKYFIVDSDDRKKPLENFFNPKEKSDNKKDKITTTTTTLKQKSSDNELPNPFMDILLSPFSLATSLGQEIKKDVKGLFSKKKKDDEEKDSLTEEILRIKKLMKLKNPFK
jgi:hypothetical protein